jgi:hypothetical protein
MPERHALDHQNDNRSDDDDVEEEEWEEGIQVNESMEYRVWSIGLRTEEAELTRARTTQRETGDRMISWGLLLMTEANFPVSGLPLNGAALLANLPTGQRVNSAR